ncbi:MAG: DNA-deoxyinosine glycosylase [Ruminococcus sp.]|nr:DNA-deoxyinosine glycosylase [Ruminococcus sp.]
MNSISRQQHNIAPVFDKNSKVLILGSFPSVMSRQQEFFYGHPRNRFWKLIAKLCGEQTPTDNESKKRLLISHSIALWDVIASCDINGSSDTSITNVVPNNIKMILECADIKALFCNGSKAFELYNRYIMKDIGINAVKLPSTSPANAACNEDRLYESWKIIKEYIK